MYASQYASPGWPSGTSTRRAIGHGNASTTIAAIGATDLLHHLAGVAEDELEDPRLWCEIIRQWSTLHPEFSYLPRKFKIAVGASAADRAATQVHDIGLFLTKNAAGETGFQVLVGGGLGRTPMIGQVVREFLPPRDDTPRADPLADWPR